MSAVPVRRLQQLAQRDFYFAAVGQLDADGVLARNRRENVDPLGAGGAGEVALQTDDLVHPHAFGRIDFVARDRRAFGDVARRHLDAELAERFDQDLLDALQFRRIGRDPSFPIVLVEEIEPGQRVVFRVPILGRGESGRGGGTISSRASIPPGKVSSAAAARREARWYRRLSVRDDWQIPPAELPGPAHLSLRARLSSAIVSRGRAVVCRSVAG